MKIRGYGKEEEPPRTSVCSIVILELKGRKARSEMVPPEGEWIHLDRWMSKERLLGHRSSGFDGSGFFVIDACTPQSFPRDLDYPQGIFLVESDFTLDGSLQAYVNDSGVGKDFKTHLYLVDLKTKVERLLLSKRSVLSPKISPDKGWIAFFEVEDLGQREF